jgi:hypothetical protein
MTNQLDSNLSKGHPLHLFSHLEGSPHDLTVEDARVALEAVQRLNAKLEAENVELRERVQLLDQLVAKLLKRNDKLSNKL